MYVSINLFPFTDHCCSVKIHKITVPSVVVMDYSLNLSENSKRPNLSAPEFVLDCEYEMEPGENNLVIKWFLNNILVYQWIPPRMPTALALFKNRIKKNYTMSEDPNKRHRGVVVMKPTLNFSGEYSCSVQTFQSSDKKSSHLQIIGEFLSSRARSAAACNDFQLYESFHIVRKMMIIRLKLTFIGFRLVLFNLQWKFAFWKPPTLARSLSIFVNNLKSPFSLRQNVHKRWCW